MKKIVKKIGYAILILLVTGLVTFFIWAFSGYNADKDVLAAALKNDKILVENVKEYLLITPLNYKGEKGYIFYGGAKVQPEAYISKLSAIANANNILIIIPKMFKNLAFFGINKAAEVRKLFPKITHWYIGGHSLGGSMACLYASKNSNSIDGILIFGTYSGTDLSKDSIKFVSINGEEDGVFSPQKIKEHKVELPKGAQITFIKGINHSDIGNYGLQPGDNPSKLINDSVLVQLVKATKSFFD